jgi:hypothetical protein
MAELTAEEARRLSRIVPSVSIEEHVKKIDDAILEATKKGHFEIPAWECLGPWTLTDAEVRAIKFHYENKGFWFSVRPKVGMGGIALETILSWNEVREMPEPAESTESNDATYPR